MKTINNSILEKKFAVTKNSWYLLDIKLNIVPNYKKGLMKIFDYTKKNQIFPNIKLPYIIFSSINKINSIDDFKKLQKFNIYFKTNDTKLINIYGLNLNMSYIKIEKVNENIAKKKVSLWRLRRLYDLEFINYYLEKLFVGYTNNDFIDRFTSDYRLFKNPNYFDKFIERFKYDKETITNTEKFNIIYLINTTIQYEKNNDTIRTHKLIKAINNDDFLVYGTTRFGYPFEYPKEYHDKKYNTELDDVIYLKLTKNYDNLNKNPITEYLEKYIIATINLAKKINPKVLHATSNYWNGIAAIYTAKYLGIKSVYEIRRFLEENSVANKLELYKSDLIDMRSRMEMFVIKQADKIITVNEELKKNIMDKCDISEDKIEVIADGIDIKDIKKYDNNSIKKILNIATNIPIVSFIGPVIAEENLELIVDTIQIIKDKYNINFFFVVIGMGDYSDKLLNYICNKQMKNNYLHIKAEATEEYYNLADFFIFPKKESKINTSLVNIFKIMATEKPILTSNIDLFKNIITDEENGIIFNNSDELVDKLYDLYTNNELKDKIATNARNWVENNSNWDTCGNKLRELYKEL